MRRNAQLRAAFLEELPRSRFHCATIPEAAPFSFVSSVRELLPPWNKLVINFCELLDVLPPVQLDHYLSSMLSCNSDGLEMPTFSSSLIISGISKPIEDFYDTIQNYVLSAFCPPFSPLGGETRRRKRGEICSSPAAVRFCRRGGRPRLRRAPFRGVQPLSPFSAQLNFSFHSPGTVLSRSPA